ncbi:MAG: flippase-like domain-containing protein [Bacteroidales bacterium]|nr:flippase-like domain-containing protein [Bacteroidales bacterium]
MKLKTNLHKTLNIIIRAAIIIIAIWFIYNEIFYNSNISNVLASIKTLFHQDNFLFYLCFIIILMPINWSVESIKWKYLIKKLEVISFIKSFKAVLTGITVSIFTPNRTGEFLGRVFILKKANHWESIFVTIIGSFSQLLITIVLGSFSMIIFLYNNLNYFTHISVNVYYGIIFIVIIINIFLLLIYFNINILTVVLKKISFKRWEEYQKHIKVFSKYSKLELLNILLLSLLRYFIFSFQFYLLLRLFSVNIPFFNGIIIISLVYLVLSAIPTVALTELGIRGSIAMYLVKIYFENKGCFVPEINIGVLSATTFLWFINLALPALAGTVFVYNLRFFKSKTKKE